MIPDRSGLDALLARPDVARLFEALDGEGEETRVVGGAIRNALLAEPVHEIDFATTALPDVTAARARRAGLKAVPTGVEHGTITVVVEGEPFEVTTLREDVQTDGRHAVVRFGRSFEADARRRDFTINALSLGADGRVHDHVGGIEDIGARRVRFIGNAATRICEDYLRILRFFRFHSAYGEGALDKAGFDAAVRGRQGLAILSRERVRAELLKLLATRRAPEVLAAMQGAGILPLLTGGVGELGRLRRVLEHPRSEGRDPVRALAALACLHEGDAERLREALRLSNDEHGRLLAYARVLSRARSCAGPVHEAEIRRLAARFGRAALADAEPVIGAEAPGLSDEAIDALRRFAAGKEPAPTLPVRGADLIAAGVPPGPGVGERLARAEERWLAEGCPVGEGVRGRLIGVALEG